MYVLFKEKTIPKESFSPCEDTKKTARLASARLIILDLFLYLTWESSASLRVLIKIS